MRYALRSLLKSPTFTLTAVITLALGIGANTAIFSVVNASMLRPLPYPEAERLLQIYVTVERANEHSLDSMMWSFPKLETMRRAQRSYETIAAYAGMNMNLTGTNEPERIMAEMTSGSYFDMLRVRPIRGRGFVAEEDSLRATHPVAVLSYALWQRRFGGDPSLVGRTIEINKRPLTVVGIAPAGFRGLTGNAELWVPLAMAPVLYYPEALDERWNHWLDVVGRLKSGVAVAQAAEEMAMLGKVVQEAHPLPRASVDVWGAAAQPMRDARVDPVLRRAVLVLFGAVGFVLLIACVNVANLQLARSASRERELAVRVALGASRGRLVRQLLIESMLLAMAGAVAGVLLALWGMDVLSTLRPEALGRMSGQTAQFLDFSAVRLDGRVLLFTGALAVLSGLLFGALPAAQATRHDLTGALKEGARGSVRGLGSLRRLNARGALIASEVALSLVLLIGAGLMLKSFARVRGTDPGFDPSRMLTFKIQPPSDSIYSFRNAPAFKEQLLERLQSIPGVEAAATNYCTPLSNACNGSVVMRIGGRPPFATGTEPEIGVHSVTPDYFRTIGGRLVRGRLFTAQDRTGAPKVLLINETAARTLFPGQDPVGQRIGIGIGYMDWDKGETAEIVGVVGDVKYGSPEEAMRPDAYVPTLAYTSPRGVYLLRTAGDPEALIPAVRRTIQAFDRDLPIYDVKTMEQRVGTALSRMRFGALMLGVFAAIALLLAAVGLYGVMAYSVAQRTRELGIRMALGAGHRDVLRLVVTQGMALALGGLAVGLAAALALTRVLASLLYGVSTTDAPTFTGIAALLAAVSFLASYLPARRATRVDPMVALRVEG